MRKLKKALKYVFFLFLFLLLTIAASGYYFLNTTNGLKQAIALANRYSGYEVNAAHVKGDVFNGIVLSDFQLKDNYLDFKSKKITLDWRVWAIWDREFVINAITVSDSTLKLTSRGDQPVKPEPVSPPFVLQNLELPFDIRLEELLVDNFVIKSPLTNTKENHDRVINKVQMRVNYVGQKAVIETLSIDGFDTKLHLSGEMLTKGDYPLTLQSDSTYRTVQKRQNAEANAGNAMRDDEQTIDVKLSGALKKTLKLVISGKGFSDFDFTGSVSSLFNQPKFDSQLTVKHFVGKSLGLADTTASGTLKLKGDLTLNHLRFHAEGDVFFDSPQTDKLRLRVNSQFDGEDERSQFILDLLTAKQQLKGNGHFKLSERSINVNVDTKAFYWPQQAAANNRPVMFKVNNTHANISGTLDDYRIEAKGSTNNQWIGELAFAITAGGDLQSLKHFEAKTHFNGDLLTLSGDGRWVGPPLFNVQVKADKISRYRQLPEIKQLALQAVLTPDNFSADGGFYLAANNVPPADIKLKVAGTLQQPSKVNQANQADSGKQPLTVTLDKARVVIKTLGGEIVTQAQGQMLPLDINAEVLSSNLQPQRYFPHMRGDINQHLQLSAKQAGDSVVAEAVIASLSGSLQNQLLSGSGRLAFDGAAQKIAIDKLKLNLAGNKADANGVFFLDGKSGQSDLKLNLDAKDLRRLWPSLSGALTANVVAKGTLREPALQADINGDNIAFNQLKIRRLSAQSTANYDSASGQLHAESQVFYDSPDTDKIQLKLQGTFDGEQVKVNPLAVDLLTAKQRITGQLSYQLADRSIQGELAGARLYWPQASRNPPVVLKDFATTLSGTLDNYQLHMQTAADTQMAGQVPLSLKVTGNSEQISRFDAEAKFNQQPFTIGGRVAWAPALAYKVRVKSADIAPFQSFPGLKRVDMTLAGDEKNYRADGGFYLYGQGLPPSDVKLSMRATSKRLQSARITGKVLGGSLDINANGQFAPLDITALIKGAHLKPQTLYPQVQANLSPTLKIRAKQQAGQLSVQTLIQQLSGTLQQYAVAGSGDVTYLSGNNQLNIKGLNLSLAGNSVKADGHLALDVKRGQSQLKARIDAPQLQRLLPQLQGAVNGDVALSGTLAKPKVSAKLSGRNLGYQDHRVAQLKADAKIDLASQAIALNSEILNAKVAGNAITRVVSKVSGKLNAHQLSLNVSASKDGAIPSVALSGSGGLNQQNLTWKGRLKALSLDNQLVGKWQTTAATSLTLSPKVIELGKLCLRQQPTALCASGRLAGNKGVIDVTMKGLSTRRFKDYFPKNIEVNTTLSGNAKIALTAGKPHITAKVSAKGGKLKIKSTSGVLTSKIQRLDTAVVLKNQHLEALVKSQLSRIGRIDIAAEMPNISASRFKANVKIDNKSLKFIERLAPQLNDVKGRLTGDMTLSGDPNKSLKVAGKITVHKTDFNVPKFGSEIRDLTLDIYAKNGNRIGFKGRASAGGGRFNIDGDVNPAKRLGTINIKGKEFQMADSRKLKVSISPNIKVILDKTVKVRGEILIPRALIVPESTGSKVTVSEDVVLPNQPKKKAVKPSPIDLVLKVKLGKDVRVASADIETRLKGALKISAQPGSAPKATGAISVQAGELRIYGQMINIERGRVIFGNGPISNPSLDIRTSRKIDDGDIVVGANVLGNVKKPQVSLFSRPKMGDASILSYLLFGRPPDSSSFGTTALLQTGGMVGVNALARDLRSSLGLDVLDFNLEGVEAGKNITKDLYVGVRSNFFENLNQFLVDYKISGRTHIEGSFSPEEISVDLMKVIETD